MNSNKLKMIGNAIPPKFTYFSAAAMKGVKPENLVLPEKVSVPLEKSKAPKTTPDTHSKKYPSTRSFKFAMPDLNFKSGTRFELNNSQGKFKCFFYYGDSKRIRELKLDKRLLNKLERFIKDVDESLLTKIKKELNVIEKYDHKKLQEAWSVKPSRGTHPFEVVDLLNSIGNSICDLTADREDEKLLNSMKTVFSKKDQVGLNKVSEHYRKIFCGLLVCASFNYKN